MPIYEYQCQVCDCKLEEFQKISDAPLSVCPSCKEPKLQKIISATHFQLKGTGWYQTDFSGKQKPKLNEGGDSSTHKKEETQTSSDSTTKTDSVSTETTSKTDSGNIEK